MSEFTLIDSDRYQDSGIETLFFPGGEPHAKLSSSFKGHEVLFFLKARTWNDTGFGACVLDALCRSRASLLHAFIPYFPAARQDRSDGLAPLTLALTGRLLSRGRMIVTTFDPHSVAMMDLTSVAYAKMPSDLGIPTGTDVVGVIAPDEGAGARAADYLKAIGGKARLYHCAKKRDPVTGNLSGYHMPPLEHVGRYIIVDDICDGGGTFNLLASAFEDDPRGRDSSLELFVSHGIFSRGLENISKKISRITTTDSWCRLPSGNRLTVLPLSPLFPSIMRQT